MIIKMMITPQEFKGLDVRRQPFVLSPGPAPRPPFILHQGVYSILYVYLSLYYIILLPISLP